MSVCHYFYKAHAVYDMIIKYHLNNENPIP